ncbi:MAG TPA: hypothetical protein VFT39_04030 [Vicinamibacterales bacterium]|nr:hypothetical protein [Vicinamibacterales bacterium]
MTTHDIPASEWPAFVERFSREHRAWLGTIHGIERGAPVTRIPSIGMESVTLERSGSEPVLRLRFTNGISLCAPRPRAVRVQQTDDGAECALEIDAAQDAFLRLGFRATARPDELDGLAPGEVMVETCPSG